MATIKITKADLIGNIENFPIEVVEKMIEEQVRQGNKADVTIFQEGVTADNRFGGFLWRITEDGNAFWDEVIIRHKFDLFFEKYPKNTKKQVFIIGDSEIGYDIIATLEARGGINKHGWDGDSDDVIYYIDPVTNYIELCAIGSDLYNVISSVFTCIQAEEHKIVISLQKIAELLDVDVNRIVIK